MGAVADRMASKRWRADSLRPSSAKARPKAKPKAKPAAAPPKEQKGAKGALRPVVARYAYFQAHEVPEQLPFRSQTCTCSGASAVTGAVFTSDNAATCAKCGAQLLDATRLVALGPDYSWLLCWKPPWLSPLTLAD